MLICIHRYWFGDFLCRYLVIYYVIGGELFLNPYKVLGINSYMSFDEASKVYKNLCKRYHPDGTEGDINKFREIQEAWESLKNMGTKAFGNEEKLVTHTNNLFRFRRI